MQPWQHTDHLKQALAAANTHVLSILWYAIPLGYFFWGHKILAIYEIGIIGTPYNQSIN